MSSWALCRSELRIDLVDLSSNHLNGTIPELMGLFKRLRYLDLSGNQFRGRLPVNITALAKLSKLVLGNNLLSGTLPNLGNLTDLGTSGISV
jgi:protein brassinosteroid insensitive 1